MKIIKCVYYLEKYCENVHTTHHNLQFNVIPTKIPMKFFIKPEQN